MANWTLVNENNHTPAIPVTSLFPEAGSNSAIASGGLIIVSVATRGTCSAVSDNVNGDYFKVGAAGASIGGFGGEVSMWSFRKSAHIFPASLTITATTTLSYGCAQYMSFSGGGDGGVDSANTAVLLFGGGATTASTNNDQAGNLIIAACANISGVTASAATGDADTLSTVTGSGGNVELAIARMASVGGDLNVSSRPMGVNWGAGSWAEVVATFWYTKPRNVFVKRVHGGGLLPVTVAWDTAVSVDAKRLGAQVVADVFVKRNDAWCLVA